MTETQPVVNEVDELVETLFKTANQLNTAAGTAYSPIDPGKLSFLLGQVTGTIIKLRGDLQTKEAQLRSSREHWEASAALLNRYGWQPFGSGTELVDPDLELEFFGQEFTEDGMPVFEQVSLRDFGKDY